MCWIPRIVYSVSIKKNGTLTFKLHFLHWIIFSIKYCCRFQKYMEKTMSSCLFVQFFLIVPVLCTCIIQISNLITNSDYIPATCIPNWADKYFVINIFFCKLKVQVITGSELAFIILYAPSMVFCLLTPCNYGSTTWFNCCLSRWKPYIWNRCSQLDFSHTALQNVVYDDNWKITNFFYYKSWLFYSLEFGHICICKYSDIFALNSRNCDMILFLGHESQLFLIHYAFENQFSEISSITRNRAYRLS